MRTVGQPCVGRSICNLYSGSVIHDQYIILIRHGHENNLVYVLSIVIGSINKIILL
jgi:hypothetical protein